AKKTPLKKSEKKLKPEGKKLKVKPKASAPKLKSVPFWIGFDLGGTKMLATVLDADYNVLGTARKATNGSDGQIKGRKKIVTTIQEAMAAAGVDPKGLQGI